MSNAHYPISGLQQGISLLIVMVMLLLCALLAVAAARTALLNEALTGNMADQQRAFAAAEALLRDAEDTVAIHLQQTSNHTAADRLPNSKGEGFLPQSANDYSQFASAVLNAANNDMPCLHGYCVFSPDPNSPLGNWWASSHTLANMWESGAVFGQYTGNSIASGNTALGNGRFWIEIYQYNKSVASQIRGPDDRHPFVYQLTSIVRGLKPGTQVILRSVIYPEIL